MTDTFTVRQATMDDVPEIMLHRCSMFTEMGIGTPDEIDAMEASFGPNCVRKWRRNAISAGCRCREWHIAGAGWLMEGIRHQERAASMLNVYTHRKYRRRGLAHASRNHHRLVQSKRLSSTGATPATPGVRFMVDGLQRAMMKLRL
jgi:ribosomal protein S18 acetylase RimI-like enzyme